MFNEEEGEFEFSTVSKGEMTDETTESDVKNEVYEETSEIVGDTPEILQQKTDARMGPPALRNRNQLKPPDRLRVARTAYAMLVVAEYI